MEHQAVDTPCFVVLLEYRSGHYSYGSKHTTRGGAAALSANDVAVMILRQSRFCFGSVDSISQQLS